MEEQPTIKRFQTHINGETINLSKGILGYTVVYPTNNPDGSINWFNFFVGGKRGLFNLLFILFLVLLFYLGIKELISNYQYIAANPCDFCKSMMNIG